MNQNDIVLEISSDEEETDWTNNTSNNDFDDHKWLTELLDEVNQEKYGGNKEEVTVVKKSERSGKKLKLKLKSSVVELDDDDDECVVLENDPNESVDVSNDNPSNAGDDIGDSDEIVVVSEKGHVACRDYPHSRHLCIKFPFSTTPNQSHCEQCYCYVCDSLAPCIYWGNGCTTTDHCHATDKDDLWRHMRKTAKSGTKPVQPVHKVADSLLLNQVPPLHRHRPASTAAPSLVQPRNHTSANFGTPNIIRKKRNHLFSSRYKFHPDLVSHYRKTNVDRTNTSYSLRTQIQRPVLKRNRLAGLCRTNIGNPSGQQNYHLNEMLSGGNISDNYIRPPSTPTAVHTTNNLNRNFQSRVNSNPVYQQPYLAPPLPPRSQVASSHSSSAVPARQSYQVHSHNPLLPVPDFPPNISNRTQPQSAVTNLGFKEKTLSSATAQGSVTNKATNELNSATSQGSVTNEAINGSSLLEVVPDELTNYDWIFDNQPVEQGFTDLHGVYGLNDFSSDSSFIDAGPIFDL